MQNHKITVKEKKTFVLLVQAAGVKCFLQVIFCVGLDLSFNLFSVGLK